MSNALPRHDPLHEEMPPLRLLLDPRGRISRATFWRWLSPIVSPRLEAVAWQSPEAWWAAPAGPR